MGVITFGASIYLLTVPTVRLTVIISAMDSFHSDDPRDPSREPSTTDAEEDTWVSEGDIQALATERDVFGEDVEMQAERILKENLPAVVHGVVKLARSAQSETVRLNAQKYIIDRNLGKISDPEPDEGDLLRDFLGGVVTEVHS